MPRLLTIVIAASIVLLAALLLFLGAIAIVSGARAQGESPTLNLMFGAVVTSLGLVLATVGGTLVLATRRRSRTR